MSHTGLAFYRRSQTLEHLSRERPKSIEALHTLLVRAVGDVETKLRRLERIFYQGMKCEDYLLHLKPIFQHVMAKFQVTFLHAGWQIRDVMKRYNKFGDQFDVDRASLSRFREFGEHLNDLYPEQFNQLITDLREIALHLKKYCRSFFKGRRDPLVEIATRHDAEKHEVLKGIEEQIDKIGVMAREYRDKGVTQKVLSSTINQLGRKTGCNYLTLLLILPEACHCIRQASEMILKWLQSDKHYPEIVKNDIDNLEARHNLQVQEVRAAREHNVLLEHRYKSLQKEIIDMEARSTRLKPRRLKLETEIGELISKLNEMKIDQNMKEEDADDLRIRVKSATGSVHNGVDSSEMSEKLESVQGELGRLRLATYMINRQIESKKSKLKNIMDKDVDIEELKKELARCSKMTLVSKTEVVLAVHELEKIRRCLAQLKDIYIKRTCPNITRKIFHNLPIATRSSSATPPTTNSSLRNKRIASSKSADGDHPKSTKPPPEPLERICLLVSRHIGTDWPKLYRALSFFPRRGEATLDQDIDQLIKTHYRTEAEVTSRQALARWRRMHSRACIKDLKDGLLEIGRRDVYNKVQEMLQSKNSKDKLAVKRSLHMRQVMSRFMMLKRLGLTLPPPNVEKVRKHGVLEQSAMSGHMLHQNILQPTQT